MCLSRGERIFKRIHQPMARRICMTRSLGITIRAELGAKHLACKINKVFSHPARFLERPAVPTDPDGEWLALAYSGRVHLTLNPVRKEHGGEQSVYLAVGLFQRLEPISKTI